MTRDEALKLLRGGKDGIRKWNRLRRAGEEIPDLSNADLSGTDLIRADLIRADLTGADLSGADLITAHLGDAKLDCTNLTDANLDCVDLYHTSLTHANVTGADFTGAWVIDTRFSATDLSEAHNLDDVWHRGPSTIGTDTLVASKGQIPDRFLRGCGLAPWEVIAAKLYDPDLSASEVNDIQYKIFEARTTGPIVVGGVFISYSHDDATFVDKIREKLGEKGVPVWLDRHDLVAGPLQEQVDRALRLNDVVLLVLSESSVESDWVEHELKTALKKEKEQKRSVLCPVTLDVAWKEKMNDVLWGQVEKKNVLDFAEWKTKAFDGQFQKLPRGLKIYYEKPGDVKKSLTS